jgi:hypothetical protein
MRPDWDRQLCGAGKAVQEGERLIADLRRIIRAELPRHGVILAQAISLAEYKPAVVRDGNIVRPAKLFVHVPDDMRKHFIGAGGTRVRRYAEALRVDVEIEGGKRRR